MQQNIHIRKANRSDLKWINSCYDTVKFIHSNFDSEIIAVAEVNSEKAGLGRLVFIDESCYELGGIYVIEKFRGLGIARKIVHFLLTLAHNKAIYCIPFKELENFYKSFGFKDCLNPDKAPQKVIEKFEFCQKTYTKPVVLLVRNRATDQSSVRENKGYDQSPVLRIFLVIFGEKYLVFCRIILS